MKNPIKTLKICNFKSIKKLELECARINIFVGKPNVGKSNILEALGLFCGSYSSSVNNQNRNLFSDVIRYNTLNNLFYDNNNSKKVTINTNIGSAILMFSGYSYELMTGKDIASMLQLDRDKKSVEEITNQFFNDTYDKVSIPNYYERFNSDGSRNGNIRYPRHYYTPIKKYNFKLFDHKKKAAPGLVNFLLPPDGSNLLEILQTHKELRKLVSSYFDEYGLKLLLDFENNSLQVQKEVDGIAYKTPFNLIADTLQRIIFHYAAIESNKESILLFEEPENHSFPPYIKELAEKIVEDKSNQYFITTHSPYLLNTIVENADDVAVFVTTFENYETKAKRLTDKDLSEMLDHGVDLFFNLKWFENE